MPQLPTNATFVVASGPSRTRRTPDAGGLCGESSGSQAANLTARIVYQKLLRPGVLGAVAPSSSNELRLVPVTWVTTPIRLLNGTVSLLNTIVGLGQR